MRITDKIKEIENYLKELETIIPADLAGYTSDLKTKAACERYFEKIVEALVDLTFLVIKEHGYRIPEEDKAAFDILAEQDVITDELARKLKEAKGMRNILAHEYGTVDDELVFEAITQELVEDARELLESIEKYDIQNKER